MLDNYKKFSREQMLEMRRYRKNYIYLLRKKEKHTINLNNTNTWKDMAII